MQRALLILLVVTSYALVAGARPWTIAPLLTVGGLAALVSPRRTFTLSTPLDRALIVLMACVALQVLPMPALLVNLLSPHHARVEASTQFAALPSSSSWTTISVDPAATAWSLAIVALGVLAFWVTRGLCGAGGHARAICRALSLIGATAALLALLQKAIAPRLLMFTVASESRSANPFGAFANRNHMAAWLLLVALPVAGYLIAQLRIHSDSRARFWLNVRAFLVSGSALTAMGLILILGVLLLTLSRSGLIGLGAAAVIGWLLGRSRVASARISWPALVGTFGVVLLAGILFIDVEAWAGRLQQSIDPTPGESNRLQIWKESVPIVKDFWLTGSGAGTFSTTMTQYQQTRFWVGSMRRWAHFNNAHSHPVQVLAEGGILLALPVLWAIVAFVALARAAIPADKGEMFWVRAGAAAGLAGLAAQSIWETSLIMPPNAVMAGVAAGLVLYRRGV